jgi:hypothetical protein
MRQRDTTACESASGERHAERHAGRRGRERVRDHVFTGHRERDRHALGRRHQRERRPPVRSQRDVVGTDVGTGSAAERHDPGGGPSGVPGHDGIVCVEDRHSFGTERFDRLRRCLHDAVP